MAALSLCALSGVSDYRKKGPGELPTPLSVCLCVCLPLRSPRPSQTGPLLCGVAPSDGVAVPLHPQEEAWPRLHPQEEAWPRLHRGVTTSSGRLRQKDEQQHTRSGTKESCSKVLAPVKVCKVL